MPSLVWTAEGGTEGATVTVGNSGGASGDAWDAVTTGTGATNIYDATTVAVGKRSNQIATGASSVTVFNQWLAKVAARWPSGMTTHYGRTYFRIASIPGADRTFVELLAADGATNRGNIRIRSTGAIRIRNAANGTVTTSATILSINTGYRIEWQVNGSVTGSWQLKIFLGNSTSPLETLSGTDNFGGVIGCVNFGYVAASANHPQLWLDAIEVNDTGLPGPASYNAIFPGRWDGSWASNADTPALRVADDFADNSVNTSLWTQFAFGSVTGSETGGTYQFAVTTAGTGGASLSTQTKRSMAGDCFATELISAGVQEAGLQAYPVEFQVDSNNRIFMNVAAGFIGCWQVVAGVSTDHGFTAYDSTLHRWFRLRESAGTTYWQVSANGVTWTTLASAANPIAVTDVTLLIATDTFLTLGGAKTVTVGQISAPVYALA